MKVFQEPSSLESNSGGTAAGTRPAAGESTTMVKSMGEQMMDQRFAEDYDPRKDTLQVATHSEPILTLASRFRSANGNPPLVHSTDRPARLEKATQQQRETFYRKQEEELWSQFPNEGETREWDKAKKADKNGNVYHVKPFERWK